MKSTIKSFFTRSLPFVVGLIAAGDLFGVTFTVENKEVEAGESIEVPVSVVRFDEIIAVQFSLEWDPGVFSFSGVRGGISPTWENRILERRDRMKASWDLPGLIWTLQG